MLQSIFTYLSRNRSLKTILPLSVPGETGLHTADQRALSRVYWRHDCSWCPSSSSRRTASSQVHADPTFLADSAPKSTIWSVGPYDVGVSCIRKTRQRLRHTCSWASWQSPARMVCILLSFLAVYGHGLPDHPRAGIPPASLPAEPAARHDQSIAAQCLSYAGDPAERESMGKQVEYGVFMPVGEGGWIRSITAPPVPATYAYNR